MTLAPPAIAGPVTYSSVYQIYLRGILLARANVELAVSAQQYQLSALLRSSGIGFLFSDASALIRTSGKILGENIEPEALQYSWTDDDSVNFARLDYADGAPAAYETNYKPETPQNIVVPVALEDVGLGTRDPFLSLLVLQSPEKGDAFCRTPMRLFDGRRLAQLSPEAMAGAPRDATTGGIACRVRWTPIAGYPKKTYERAEEMRPVDLEFVGIANGRFMAPREVNVVTRFGTVRIVAVQPFRESNLPIVPAKLSPPPPDDEEW